MKKSIIRIRRLDLFGYFSSVGIFIRRSSELVLEGVIDNTLELFHVPVDEVIFGIECFLEVAEHLVYFISLLRAFVSHICSVELSKCIVLFLELFDLVLLIAYHFHCLFLVFAHL